MKISIAEQGRLPGSWQWDHRPGDHASRLLFWLVTENGARLRDGGEMYDLERGDCLIMRMGTPKCGRHDPDRPMSVSWMLFDLVTPGGKIVVPEADELAVWRKVAHYSFVRDMTERCVDSFNAGGSPGPAGQWMKCILQELLDQDARAVEHQNVLPAEQKIDLLCAAIVEHPELKYRVETMARQAGCSEDHFIRLFKAIKRTTPGAFIVKARLDAAQKHLAMSSMRICEIAELLGYSDHYFFSRQFKQHVGVSPSQYRNLI